MSPEFCEKYYLSPEAAAFLDTLEKYVDEIVTPQDLKEAHPEIEWTGQVAKTWVALLKLPEYENRLFVYGDGSTTAYTLLSRPNDLRLVHDRAINMAEYMSREGQIAPEKERKLWLKRAAAIGAIATTVASGVALGVLMKNRRKK